MDTILLTALLNPVPMLFSWLTWLHPSTARLRITYDIAYFANLCAVNHGLEMRFVARPGTNPIQDGRLVEGGFELRAVPGRLQRVGEDLERETTPTATRVRATATRTTAATEISEQEEESQRYLARAAQLRTAQAASRRRATEQKREQRDREEWTGIATENEGNAALSRARQGETQIGSGFQQDANVDAEMAWRRYRREARRRYAARAKPVANSGQAGTTKSVWELPNSAAPGAAGNTSRAAGAIVWGDMPALGS